MVNISLNGHVFETLRNPTPIEEEIDNVIWTKIPGGSERAVKLGGIVRHRAYTLWLDLGNSPDDESYFDSFTAGLSDFSTTFTLIDHNSVSMTVRFLTPPKKKPEGDDYKLVEIDMIEVLP